MAIKKSSSKAKKTVKKAVKTASSASLSSRRKADIPPTQKKEKLTPRDVRILAIRDRLSKQKDALLSEAESAMNNVLPDQTTFPDLGDQAAIETDRNFMLRLRGREQRLLKKIEEAIDRIDGGTYGICEICGLDIQIKRLEARPVTTMCIECKTEQEEEEKLMSM